MSKKVQVQKTKIFLGNDAFFKICLDFDENLKPIIDCSGCEDPILEKNKCIDICYNNFR